MPIRQSRPTTEEFVRTFQSTIVPSAILSEDFINWYSIEAEIAKYEVQIDAILDLEGLSESAFIDGLADALMNADDTRKWIDFYFELLGERGVKYSAYEGVWKFNELKRAIDSGDRRAAQDVAVILQEIGLQHIVEKANVRDHYRGMLVGMESHARKNRQGTAFEKLVEQRIEEIANHLSQEGYSVALHLEYRTMYNDESGQNKTVDFAIFENDELRLVVEANAYKVGGSKPSEIRRSYNHVAQRMRRDGIGFVWITDGQAWAKSLTNVLRQSYEDIVDVYNLEQARTQLPDDVVRFFQTGKV